MTTAGTTTQAPAADLIRYHWVMTLQGPAAGPGGWVTKTVDGSGNLAPGTSRAAAYRACMREAQRMIRESEHGGAFAEAPATVLFFSLEPDELPGRAGGVRPADDPAA
jgi:hypothetical protein